MSEVKNLNDLFENTKNTIKETSDINKAIEAGFDALANYLMNECILDINGNEYRIAEIEFYYFNEKEHKDLYSHCDNIQKNTNTFYIHTTPNIYNRVGMDITFGNKEKSYYGGILIRTIKPLKLPYIIGPGKVRKHIQETLNIENDLQKFKDIYQNQKINDNSLNLYIKKSNYKYQNKKIIKSCRVGLKINNSSKCINDCFKLYSEIKNKIITLKKEFIFKPYRYILNDEELIYKLLYRSSDEPTFLAWFLKNENFNMLDLNKRVKNLLKNLTENKESFLKVCDLKKNLRDFFIKEKIEKKSNNS